MPRGREAPDVADRGQQRARGDEVDARAGSAADASRAEASTSSASARSITRDLTVEEVDLAQARLDHLPLVGGSCLAASQRRPATPNTSLPASDPSGCGSGSRAPGSSHACAAAPAARGGRSAGAGPASARPASRPRAGSPPRAASPARARRACPSSPACVVALDRLRVGEHDPSHMRLEDPGDRQPVPRRLEHHLIVARQGSARTARARPASSRPAPPAAPAALGDRDLTEVTMHIQRDDTHPTSSRLDCTRRRGGQNDNYGSVLAAHPGSRRGGQLQTAGSQPIVSATACPTSSLPEAPVPEQPRRYPGPGHNRLHRAIFMPLQPPAATQLNQRPATHQPRSQRPLR